MNDSVSIPLIREIPETELFSGLLTKELAQSFSDSLADFHSESSSVNRLLKKKFNARLTKKNYDNREIMLTCFHDSPRFKRPHLVSVNCFCAYCIRSSIEMCDEKGQRCEEVNLPAVKILTFAVSNQYTKRRVIINTIEGKQETCANFIFADFMRYLDQESSRIGITHAHILLNHPLPVVSFFHGHGFFQYSASTRSFEDEPGDHEYCYIRVLKNASGRTVV